MANANPSQNMGNNNPSPQSSGSDLDCEIINLGSNFITFEDIQENYMPDTDIFVTYRIGKHFTPSSCDWIGLFGSDWVFPSQVLMYKYAPQTHNGHPYLRNVLFDGRNLPCDNSAATYQFLYISNGDQVIGTSNLFKIHNFIPDTDMVNFEFVDHLVDNEDLFTIIKTDPAQKGLLRSFEVIKNPEFDHPVVKRCSSDHVTLATDWTDNNGHWTDLLQLELDLSDSDCPSDLSSDDACFLCRIAPDIFEYEISTGSSCEDHWQDLLNIEPDILKNVKPESKKDDKKKPCEAQLVVVQESPQAQQSVVPYVPIYTANTQQNKEEAGAAINSYIQSLLVLSLAKIAQQAKFNIEKPLALPRPRVTAVVKSASPDNNEEKESTMSSDVSCEKKQKSLPMKCLNCRRRLKNFLRLKRQQVDLQNKLSDLESQLEASDSLMLSKNILMEEFSKQVKSLVSENGKLVAINEKLYEEKLKSEKDKKIRDILQQSVDRLTFSIKMDSLEQDKKQLTQQVSSLTSQVNSLKKQDEVKKLKKETHRLRSSLFSEELKITFLTKEKEDQGREIATLRRQLKQKEAEFDFAWAQKRAQTSELEEAKQFLQNCVYIISTLHARGFQTIQDQGSESGHSLELSAAFKIAGLDSENPLYYPDIVVPVAVKCKLNELIQGSFKPKPQPATDTVKSKVQCSSTEQDIRNRISTLQHALEASELINTHFQNKCKHAAIPLPPKVHPVMLASKTLPMQYSDVVKMDPPVTKATLTPGLTSVVDTADTGAKRCVRFDEMATVKVEETVKAAAIISQIADVRPKTHIGKQKTLTETRASNRFKPYDRKSGKRSQSQEVREIIRDLVAEDYTPVTMVTKDAPSFNAIQASCAAALAWADEASQNASGGVAASAWTKFSSRDEKTLATGAPTFKYMSSEFPCPLTSPFDLCTSTSPAPAVDINNNSVKDAEKDGEKEEEEEEAQDMSWGSFTDLANRKRPASPVVQTLIEMDIFESDPALDEGKSLLQSQAKFRCTSPSVPVEVSDDRSRCKRPPRKFVRYYRKNSSKGKKNNSFCTSSPKKVENTKVAECLDSSASSGQTGSRGKKQPFRSTTAGQRWSSSFRAYSGSSE